MHPDEMKDIDPTADFKKFHEDWLPYSGTFFTL